DLSRTFVLGRVDGRLREIYRVVEEAQQAAFLAIKPGAGCREVDLKAREVVEKAGYGDRFIHGLGHGVGLQVHEFPRMSRWAPEESKLDVGMVVTVEPGVYIPGLGGIRLEDMVVVTEGGCRVLTRFPKLLEVVNH
ncbi:MAG: M24 family metallopeptidase, partial [Clostridia bacterium]|nr:M24 family metallopeptidase [Clostridia bacterium]